MSKSIRQIIADTARHFQVSEKTIRGPSQERLAVFPRQVAMYVAHRTTAASYPRIGREFGGRHHTTVISSVRQVERRMAADPELARMVAALSAEDPSSHFREQEILSMRFRDLERTMLTTRRALATMEIAVAEIRGQLESRTEVNANG